MTEYTGLFNPTNFSMLTSYIESETRKNAYENQSMHNEYVSNLTSTLLYAKTLDTILQIFDKLEIHITVDEESENRMQRIYAGFGMPPYSRNHPKTYNYSHPYQRQSLTRLLILIMTHPLSNKKIQLLKDNPNLFIKLAPKTEQRIIEYFTNYCDFIGVDTPNWFIEIVNKNNEQKLKTDNNSSYDSSSLKTRERNNLHRAIGALLAIIEGTTPSGKTKFPNSINRTWVIKTILENYPGIEGLSESNLERLLPKAEKSLKSD